MHYGTVNGPACGAWFYHVGITAIGDVALATCRRCKRTDAYRRALRGDLSAAPLPPAARVKVGTYMETWFDTGAMGASLLYGRVIASGPKTYRVRWESGLTNRVQQDNDNVKPARAVALAEVAMVKWAGVCPKLPAYATGDAQGISTYPALLLRHGAAKLLHVGRPYPADGGAACGAQANGRPTNLVEYVGEKAHPVCRQCRTVLEKEANDAKV